METKQFVPQCKRQPFSGFILSAINYKSINNYVINMPYRNNFIRLFYLLWYENIPQNHF